MAEYQLYCFAQSGNAYRAALMLNLIGAEWEPIWYRFLRRGVAAHAGIIATSVNEMGEVPVLVHGDKKLTPVGRDPHLSRERIPASSSRRARTRSSKRCAGSSSTIRRSTAFSGRIAF